MAKRALDVRRAMRLVNHGPVVLVSCRHENKSNIITLAWTSPVSAEPPMVAVAVAPSRFSHGLIAESGEFVVNVPASGLLNAVWYCGTVSGRELDKFGGAGLSEAPASSVQTPLVAECFAHLECRVSASHSVGDHTLFAGEIVAASAENEAFDGQLTLKRPYITLHHLGGHEFVTAAGKRLTAK
jgi:flavin reductase (DIM6/NTAB) family NADH-FMN oxidoreductase RutF